MTLLEWVDALKDPLTQAIIIAAASAVAAALCFRAARSLELPDPEEPAAVTVEGKS